MKKIFYTLMLIISIILSCSVIAYANETVSGTCGDGLTWELDGNGTLEISGTGHMYDFVNTGIPWDEYREDIKNVIIGDGVLSISRQAFWHCVNMESIDISETVKYIYENSFVYCTSLKNIHISAQIERIDYQAFAYCLSLEYFDVDNNNNYFSDVDGNLCNKEGTILYQYAYGNGISTYTIPSTIEIIENASFIGCKSLTGLITHDNVIEIRGYSFIGCTELESVVIGDGVTTIGDSSFALCMNLSTIEMGSSVETIGPGAFTDCTALESIDLPSSLKTIDTSAFWGCSKLTRVRIPSNVTSIGSSAFSRCDSLEYINISKSVESIGPLAFAWCPSLDTISVNSRNEYFVDVDDVLFDINESILIRYPSALSNSSYTVPETVTAIAPGAFSSSDNLTSITIGSQVNDIGIYAFDDCKNITIYGYEDSYAQEYAKNNNISFAIIEAITPAEKLCDLINAEKSNSCEVDIETQTVTLLSDVSLSQTLQIPTDRFITLDIGEFDITGADDCDAINISEYASIKIIGTGTIKGGDVTLNGYNGGKGINNEGILYLWGPTVVGGDVLYYTDDYTGELIEFGYPGSGVYTHATCYTYFIEGMIIAGNGGEGYYYANNVHFFDRGALSVIKESDDGENYTVVSELYSYRKYLKAIKISGDLTAPEQLVALLNEIQSGTCVLDHGIVTLNKDFSCPYEIIMPSGDQIVLNLNRYTITTDDFFAPFILSTNTDITLTGGGTITNKERSSGSNIGIGGGAALLTNEGKLTIEGTTVIGNGLNGIYNEGELIVNRGTITVTDAYNAKDAIINDSDGTITVNGGKIVGGNATGDGNNGGDGISSMQSSVILDENYPIKLNGGELIGGLGMGDGENGIAISECFNVGENYVAYESNDGNSYSVIDGFSSDMQYVKITSKTNAPEIEDIPGGNLGDGDFSYNIFTHNIYFNDTNLTCDLVLYTNNTISGKIYVGVYEDANLISFTPYTTREEIPLSVNCVSGQKIKIFWWDENLIALSLPAEINV